jgi:hypothetical protein
MHKWLRGARTRRPPTQPDSALKSHSQEWNFGESHTSGARIPREGGRIASGTNQRPYWRRQRERGRMPSTPSHPMRTVKARKQRLEKVRRHTRQVKKEERVKETITAVQLRAASKKTGTAEMDEDLYSVAVAREWMSLLFNGMIGRDANPDGRQDVHQPDLSRGHQPSAMGRLRRRLQDPIDTVDQRQPPGGGEVNRRHTTTALSRRRDASRRRRHDASRSRDRVHIAHTRMAMPQRDLLPGDRRHRMCRRQPHP